MNPRTLHSALLAAAMCLATTAASSADQLVSFATGGYASQLRTPEMMHKIDANGDGMVAKAEWDAFQEKLFSMMDGDKSGTLTSQEFMRTGGTEVASFATGGFANSLRTKEMLTRLDTDGDGQVSRAEFTTYQSKVFDMMDTGKKQMLDKTTFFGRGPS